MHIFMSLVSKDPCVCLLVCGTAPDWTHSVKTVRHHRSFLFFFFLREHILLFQRCLQERIFFLNGYICVYGIGYDIMYSAYPDFLRKG